ncbi:hypothetical protein KSP39_PZI012875 [Platanthera zijinensis]|uniref:Uncharacterized protein n=1 Tax=Platanthera zijinensis TaxID=2320716 RepID=A0AAP0BC74_9ASPA
MTSDDRRDANPTRDKGKTKLGAANIPGPARRILVETDRSQREAVDPLQVYSSRRLREDREDLEGRREAMSEESDSGHQSAPLQIADIAQAIADAIVMFSKMFQNLGIHINMTITDVSSRKEFFHRISKYNNVPPTKDNVFLRHYCK